MSLARSTARATQRLNKAAGRQAAKHAPALRKSAERMLSGVATPAAPPAVRGSGRWEEGRWGLGPWAMRRYRLFLPPGIGARRSAPLVMLLHGCGQDAASFAAATHVAAVARAGGFAVLLPEQAVEANPQRCWNWFRAEAIVAGEADALMAILDHVCNLHPLRRDRVFVLGLSAGGAMAMTLALRHPERFVAVGSHSGAVPHSAATPAQAGQAMRGHRGAEVASLRRRLGRRLPPPLLLIHGEADRTVAPANAEAAARLWLDLAAQALPTPPARTMRRGRRYPYDVVDWKRGGQPYVRLMRVAQLGHAWSGGAPHQAFSDPRGPDALRLAWRFFAQCAEIAAERKASA